MIRRLRTILIYNRPILILKTAIQHYLCYQRAIIFGKLY